MKKKKKALAALHITLPSKWSDLSAQQVQRVAYYRQSQLSETEYLVRLAAEFADLKPRGSRVTESGEMEYRFYHRDRGNVWLSAEDMALVADALRWTTGDPEPMAAPPLDGYTVPDSSLYGISLEQFITADTACAAYIRLKDERALRVMTAALYPRRAFDPDSLEAEARRLANWPMWQLMAVLMWFCGAKKALCKKYPYVFSTGDDAAAPIQGDELMMGLLSSLNDGRVADNEQIRRIDIHEALFEVNRKIKASQSHV